MDVCRRAVQQSGRMLLAGQYPGQGDLASGTLSAAGLTGFLTQFSHHHRLLIAASRTASVAVLLRHTEHPHGPD